MEAEIISGNPAPSIKDLNNKAIKTLYDLLDKLGQEEKSNPAMVTAVTDAIAKLNTSLRNNDIISQEETEAERRERETQETIMEALNA